MLWDTLVGTLEGLATQYGYPGVFVISAVSSAIPFLPIPYLLVVVFLGNAENPLLLGVVAGTGAAVGKISSYLLGRFGYRVTGTKTRGNLDVLHNMLTKYGALGVFIFAATPLPDDLYIIPIGIIRLPFLRFFLANLAGKIVLSVAIAYLGRAYFASVGSFLGDSIIGIIATIALTLVLSVLLMRADWVSAIEIARKQGLRGVVTRLPEILQLTKKSRNRG